jgi:hypothetical protein
MAGKHRHGYRLTIPVFEIHGPEVSRISDFFGFGTLSYYNEIAWGWERNLNAKSVYVSCTAYEYVGFI